MFVRPGEGAARPVFPRGGGAGVPQPVPPQASACLCPRGRLGELRAQILGGKETPSGLNVHVDLVHPGVDLGGDLVTFPLSGRIPFLRRRAESPGKGFAFGLAGGKLRPDAFPSFLFQLRHVPGGKFPGLARQKGGDKQTNGAVPARLVREFPVPVELEKLLALDGLERLRLLYLYPGGLTRDLLRFLRGAGKTFVPYFDMPQPHAHPDILSRMGRPFSGNPQEAVDRIREFFPEAALRTTMMVGFPGETDEHFRTLMDFVERNEASGDALVIRPKRRLIASRIEKRADILKDLYAQGYECAKDVFLKNPDFFPA